MSALIDSAVVKAVAAAQESGQLPQTEGSAGSDNAAGDPANVALMLLEALSEEDVRVEGVRQRLQSGELGTEEAVKEVLSLGPMPNAELGGSAQLPALREDRMVRVRDWIWNANRPGSCCANALCIARCSSSCESLPAQSERLCLLIVCRDPAL